MFYIRCPMGRGSVRGFIVLVCGLFLLAGCGGSSSSLTKGQFLAQGTTICKQAEERRSQAMANAYKTVPQAQDEQIPTQEKAQLAGLPPYEDATRALEALGVPDEGGEALSRLLRAREEAAVRVREAPATAYFSTYPFREANELAEAYGLSACLV